MNSHDERRAHRRRWNGNEVISQIKKVPDRSAKAVQKTAPALYGAAVRLFGSWRAAVGAAGQDYSRVRKRRQPGFWTEERVLFEIRCLKDKSSGSVRKQRADLYNAALRVLGSWRKAVEKTGVDYETIQRGWVSRDHASLRFRKSRAE